MKTEISQIKQQLVKRLIEKKMIEMHEKTNPIVHIKARKWCLLSYYTGMKGKLSYISAQIRLLVTNYLRDLSKVYSPGGGGELTYKMTGMLVVPLWGANRRF